jgi:hypothetical protein
VDLLTFEKKIIFTESDWHLQNQKTIIVLFYIESKDSNCIISHIELALISTMHACMHNSFEN